MNQLDALQEAIAALATSETESRQYAGESFIDHRTKAHWLSSAERAKEARHILVDMLATLRRQEGE